MSSSNYRDPFHPFHTSERLQMHAAWDRVRIPGPPAELALLDRERSHPDPQVRFARHLIQQIELPVDTLALIDKASPHSQFDLMIAEISRQPKSTPTAVAAATACCLWRTGSNFARFVTRADVIERYGLAGGELHLALNCDPNTRDRESVQASKQFHLHLLYWQARELAPLQAPPTLARLSDARLLRQILDPGTLLGARLLHESLQEFPLEIDGARRLVPDTPESPAPGCTLVLPGWETLASPAFESLMRRLHSHIEILAADLLEIFTATRVPAPDWQRPRLLPGHEISARIARTRFSRVAQDSLEALAHGLRDLAPATARRLARGPAAQRMHLMTLNQPSYALALHAPHSHPGDGAPAEIHLRIQPKLFSGIGGAGLLALGGVPCVRVLRGQGTFDAAQWQARTDFQRQFARFNQEQQGAASPQMRFSSIRHFDNSAHEWQ